MKKMEKIDEKMENGKMGIPKMEKMKKNGKMRSQKME